MINYSTIILLFTLIILNWSLSSAYQIQKHRFQGLVRKLKAFPRVEIEYCTGCKWMLRSAWLAQELLTTFEKSIGEVALIPSRPIDGQAAGTFIVRVEGKVIWNRKDSITKGFPDAKELKQRVRDIIDPNKDLGHSDDGERKNSKVMDVYDAT